MRSTRTAKSKTCIVLTLTLRRRRRVEAEKNRISARVRRHWCTSIIQVHKNRSNGFGLETGDTA